MKINKFNMANGFLFYISIFSFIIKIVSGNDLFVVLFIISGMTSLFINFNYFSKIDVIFLAGLCLLILTSGLINSSEYDKNYVLYIGYFFSCLGFSISILKTDKSHLFFLYFIFGSSLFLFYVKFFEKYDANDFNSLISGGSRNYISGYLSLFTILYVFLCAVRNVKINVFVVYINIICSFLLYGRSGIIVSVMIFFSVFVFRKGIRNSFFISIPIVLISIFSIWYYLDYLYELFISTNFSRGLESERTRMFFEYLHSLDSINKLIFGNDLTTCCDYISQFDNNPHNTFIMAHSRFGLWIFLVIFMLCIFICAKFLKRGKEFLKVSNPCVFGVILMFVVFIRYYIDQFGLFGITDFIPFTIILYITKSSSFNEKNMHSNR